MKLLENLSTEKLQNWFATNSGDARPIFYSSVDIRDSGFKIAPVDTNIFPAGFNQLSEAARKKASEEVAAYIKKYYPQIQKVGLIAENFSRNKFYWENITALKSIIENAGFQTLVGTTDAITEELTPQPLTLERKGDKLFFGTESPCLIIANRDFTGGSPPELKNISQIVIPPVSMGWYRRRKSNHFDAYNKIAANFATDFGFDSWLISGYHERCGKVDFKKSEGLECVAVSVEKTLHKIRKKYEEHNINSEPYVFVKSDSGTFGMGIMTVKSGAEIFELNKKERNKMDTIKEGVHNTEVIIQEGIPTIHEVAGKTAEPFVYLIGGKPVGAILRVNANRDKFGNLNSSGMEFEKMECNEISDCENSPFGIIARLASLAALNEENEDLRLMNYDLPMTVSN